MPDIRDIWLNANNIINSARVLINEDLKPLNLSSAEGNILLHLLPEEDGLWQEELVAQLEISKPAVSRALKSLEEKGFITRQKGSADKRACRVNLTAKAREIGPQVEQVYNRVYSIATTVVTEKEVQDFIDLFSRVSASFSKARAKR